ncbi:hypothetical protein GCM10010340_29100 [Streptomyces griseoloalbus]|nr:hypothetical protein GCM10010340_29100 [Streptomyces albaduncus]
MKAATAGAERPSPGARNGLAVRWIKARRGRGLPITQTSHQAVCVQQASKRADEGTARGRLLHMPHRIGSSRRLRPPDRNPAHLAKGVTRPAGLWANPESGDRVGQSLCRFAEACIPLRDRHAALMVDRGR